MRGGSFTDRVIAEIAPHVPPLECCRAALLEGMTLAGDPDAPPATVDTSRPVAARAAVATLHADARAAHAIRVSSPRIARLRVDVPLGGRRSSPQKCCRRSRLRGAFLTGGSVNRPEQAPHLEIVCRADQGAEQLIADLDALDVPAAVRWRRGRPVVTVRNASGVGAALSSMGAQAARLHFEDGRVVRDVRATVNRALNAETANLRRTVDASVHQVAAASRLAADSARWETLPAALREAALLRRFHPDDPLERLADRAGISRPAMAGRLRRLMEAAQA